MKLIQTHNGVPKKSVATIAIMDSESSRLPTIMEWMRENMTGTVWWKQTQFRDPRVRGSYCTRSSHQRNFKDGYWLFDFYFSTKVDAAKTLLWWGAHRWLTP